MSRRTIRVVAASGRYRPGLASTVALVALTAIGCGDRAPEDSSIGSGMPRVEPVATYGCAECEGPEQLAFAFLSVGPSGRIYIADRFEPHMRVLDPEGGFLFAVGEDGEGPGEIRMGQAILGAIEAPDRSFWVQEVFSFHRFDHEGAFVTSEPYRVRLPIGVAYDHGREQVYFYGYPGPTQEGFGTGLASVFRWTIGTEEPEVVLDSEHFPRNVSDPDRSSPDVAIAVSPDGRLVVADGWDYRLRFYDLDGMLRYETGRDIERVAKSEDELAVERERARQMAERAGSEIRQPRLQKAHIAPYGLAFDGAGRLWAVTPRGEGVLDVFAADGAYLTEVVLGTRLVGRAPSFAIGGDILAAVVRDDDGIDRVRVWKIRSP